MHRVHLQSLRTRKMWHKVNFLMRNLTGLNVKICYFSTGCPIKIKEPCLTYDLLISGKRTIRYTPYPRYLAYVKCKQLHPGFELWSLSPFPTEIIATPQVLSYTHTHTHIYIYIYYHSVLWKYNIRKFHQHRCLLRQHSNIMQFVGPTTHYAIKLLLI